ncbi:MAG: HlyD family efflux transporter periplasmic adaptor subunit [Planctomycetota bacterium]
MFGPQARHDVNYKRVATSISALLVVALSMFVILRGPATKSAPAIVQFKDEVILRAGADGFISRIAVEDGQPVHKGDTLIELENAELTLEVTRLRNELEKSDIQIRIHRQTGESALVISETKNLESLKQQLREKEEQAAGLAIVAPEDGFVYARNLENRIGSFVHRGDVILNFAQKQTKEIIVTIDQADLESIKGNEGNCLRVAFPGVEVLNCRLQRINPRASDVPRFPSLCATSGGPLAVIPASSHEGEDQSSYLLLSPRFTAELAVETETSRLLQSGQRGRAFFKTQQQSLGSWLYIAAERWLEEKIETAAQYSAF